MTPVTVTILTMAPADAVKLAREAGYSVREWCMPPQMLRLIELAMAVGARAEREACKQLCQDYANEAFNDGDPEADHEGAALHLADQIEARNGSTS